ncbi:hypothetical protein FPOA_06695 [Fusarium poae]|uniref:Uncharacterized protein n=1 Tax=Fusarium poae TaxID=36050 RepID=A0A1B8AIG6_FUSPO|nr:hypothetical protein FPOA_06695 [Fusarium poae]
MLESDHRTSLYHYWGTISLRMAGIPCLQGKQALDFFNKTVPIYMLRGDKQKRGLYSLLTVTLHNYLYRKWFRPYRTDIERGQFIAKVIDVEDQPESSDEATAVNVAMTMRSAIHARLLNLPPKQFYNIRTLFKALIVVIPAESYYICSSICTVSIMTVLVFLTGENDGLSGPISFDSIDDKVERVFINGMHGVRTKLEVAVEFIMFLEQREDTAFGPQPDPVASTAGDTTVERMFGSEPIYTFERSHAKKFGWRYGPIVGPSSKWVSMTRYPKWTGFGARANMVCLNHEASAWVSHSSRCTCYTSQQTEEVEGKLNTTS